MKEKEFIEVIAELFEWYYTNTPIDHVWCRDDQVIHTDEELMEKLFKEVKKVVEDRQDLIKRIKMMLT